MLLQSKTLMFNVFFLSLFILGGCSTADKREIASLNARNRDLQWESAERQREADKLAEENRTLEAEKIFNDKFEKMRRTFGQNEADVYRQGNSLVIRLKGLKFPSSEADLKGENFTLLAKVQKAIKEFDRSSVLVEGHADGSGGKRINTKVARKRAQTVRDYFISNGVIGKDKIRAVGHRDDMPLASNKTNAGKAQNRRVDVVISL